MTPKIMQKTLPVLVFILILSWNVQASTWVKVQDYKQYLGNRDSIAIDFFLKDLNRVCINSTHPVNISIWDGDKQLFYKELVYKYNNTFEISSGGSIKVENVNEGNYVHVSVEALLPSFIKIPSDQTPVYTGWINIGDYKQYLGHGDSVFVNLSLGYNYRIYVYSDHPVNISIWDGDKQLFYKELVYKYNNTFEISSGGGIKVENKPPGIVSYPGTYLHVVVYSEVNETLPAISLNYLPAPTPIITKTYPRPIITKITPNVTETLPERLTPSAIPEQPGFEVVLSIAVIISVVALRRLRTDS
jgi:hypothetical protein